jgi:hypothetical protein
MMETYRSSQRRCATIDACLDCYQACLHYATALTASHIGMETTALHGEYRRIMACAEISRTTAHFFLVQSDFSAIVARACAEICRRCAAEIQALGAQSKLVNTIGACADACESIDGT